MITYNRIPDHYALIRKYEDEFPEAAASLKMRGMLKDSQNWLPLNQILWGLQYCCAKLDITCRSCLMVQSITDATLGNLAHQKYKI